MVAVPNDLGADDSSQRVWATDAAELWGRTHGLSADRIASMAAAMQVVAKTRTQEAASSTLVVYDPITMAVAPVVISLVEGEPSRDEQLRFLRPGAPLAGQLRLTPPTAFGVGCSSAFPTERRGIAEVRWLFVAGGHALAVVVSPVAQSAALSVGVTVEDLLTAVAVNGAELSPATHFHPETLVRIDDATQPAWSS
ncbi:MAG: hypothetical protein ACQEW8_06025 [Actinomycetota bacterium]